MFSAVVTYLVYISNKQGFPFNILNLVFVSILGYFELENLKFEKTDLEHIYSRANPVTGQAEFQCGLCRNYIKPIKQQVKKHVANFHSRKADQVDCHFCGRVYKNMYEYNRHIQRNRCRTMPAETIDDQALVEGDK